MENNKKVLFSQIVLKNVNRSDHKFLYELLGERKPIENISHKKMPIYREHVKFVNSKPYSRWYVVHYRNQKVGTIYLTKRNEIGIHIKKGYQRHGLGKYAMNLLIKKNPNKRYLANINPKNKKSIKFFTKQGFKLIQYTYEMIPGNFRHG